MAKHWKFEDDEFLASYFDAVGDYIGEHDFGRPKGAATRRVAALKESGAWDALVKMQRAEMLGGIASIRAEMEYAKALGFRVEDNGVSDEDAECPADIYSGNYPWRRNPFGEDPDDFEDDLLNEALALLRLVRLHAPDCKLPAGKGAHSRLHSAVDALLSKAGA